MLTPLDIEKKKFSKKINGYSVEEVDDFLDELTVEYERLYKENAEYKEQLEQGQSDIAQYKNVEKTLRDTLVMAQLPLKMLRMQLKNKQSKLLEMHKVKLNVLLRIWIESNMK